MLWFVFHETPTEERYCSEILRAKSKEEQREEKLSDVKYVFFELVLTGIKTDRISFISVVLRSQVV